MATSYSLPVTLTRYNDGELKNKSGSSMVKCCFCGDFQLSTSALRTHLTFCGNKTDQCPKCHKFITRATFAYHYENKCATLDDIDELRSRSDRRNSLTHEKLKKCNFCDFHCAVTDFTAHQEKCIQNPDNLKKKIEQKSLQAKSLTCTDIPCEFCNKLIDFANWTTHTTKCREQEARRIRSRQRAISQERIVEKFPCEYCEESFAADLLLTHQIICRKNSTKTLLLNTLPLPENRRRHISLSSSSSMPAYNLYGSYDNPTARINNHLRSSDSPPLINSAVTSSAYNLIHHRTASLSRGGVSSTTSNANKPLRSTDNHAFSTSLDNNDYRPIIGSTARSTGRSLTNSRHWRP
ncbi:unnamed protein product [Adineta ricciae]|uniref:Uncharacterized protein n=1 Tax=Adineta ricciae TaxID=249248 RepID=A0A816A1M1_ADIRI|nr:unnamed protein product [Adineta ricciae]